MHTQQYLEHCHCGAQSISVIHVLGIRTQVQKSFYEMKGDVGNKGLHSKMILYSTIMEYNSGVLWVDSHL